MTNPSKEKEVATKSDRYLTDKEASALTGLSVAWFQRARWAGEGPPFVKLSHAVRYRESDLRAWLDAHIKRSTNIQ